MKLKEITPNLEESYGDMVRYPNNLTKNQWLKSLIESSVFEESNIEWRRVEEWPNYEVSSDGRVRRITTKKEIKPWKSPRRNGSGFDLRVSLYKGGVKKNPRIHRLVAKAFLPNPENLPEVDHTDGNTTNNNGSNLEWVTSAENIRRQRERLKAIK